LLALLIEVSALSGHSKKNIKAQKERQQKEIHTKYNKLTKSLKSFNFKLQILTPHRIHSLQKPNHNA
jgi:hypothetical protein